MRFIRSNTLVSLSLVVAIFLIGFSIFYYLVIFLPQKERRAQETKAQEQIPQALLENIKQEAKENQANNTQTRQLTLLDECLNRAKTEKARVTEELIKWAGVENKDGKYDLTGAFDGINKQYEQDREECFRKYPQ